MSSVSFCSHACSISLASLRVLASSAPAAAPAADAADAAAAAAADAVAASYYRRVLVLEADVPAPKLRLDPLQKLHASAWLAASLARDPASAQTVEALRNDVSSLVDAYLAPLVSREASAAAEVAKAVADSDPARLPPGADAWWLSLLRAAGSDVAGRGSGLARKLSAAVLGGSDAAPPFSDANGAAFWLAGQLKAFGAAHKSVVETSARLERLTAAASPEHVYAAGHCSSAVCGGERGAGASGVTCAHCAAQPAMDGAEQRIFSRNVDVSMPGRFVEQAKCDAGVTRPSGAEQALKALLAASTRGAGDASAASKEAWVRHAHAQLASMEATRRLCAFVLRQGGIRGRCRCLTHALADTKASACRLLQRQLLAARDELDMSRSRVRLRSPGEGRLPPRLASIVLEPSDVAPSAASFASDLAGHELALARARAQCRFLAAHAASAAASSPDNGGGGETSADLCPVCHDPLSGARSVFPCGHGMCCGCCAKLLSRSHGQQGAACPSCRARAQRHDIVTVANTAAGAATTTAASAAPAAPDAAASTAAAQAPPPDGACAASSVAAASAALLASLCHPMTGEAAVDLLGSWGTKLDAVVRRAKWLLHGPPAAAAAAAAPGGGGDGGDSDGGGGGVGAQPMDCDGDAAPAPAPAPPAAAPAPAPRPPTSPAVKVLIFSEWADVLAILEKALAANGVATCRPAPGKAGARALARFRASPDPTALILPLSRGANGLNLVEAAHVILVEPSLDGGAEQQAVKRVDRIGQASATCVHRFMADETVEVNVRALAAAGAAAAVARRCAAGGGGGDAGDGDGAGDGGAKAAPLRCGDILALTAPPVAPPVHRHGGDGE